MRHRIAGAIFVFVLAAALAPPASAANKEHQQLMADIRMLQEQSQLLQNLLGTLNDSIKAVNARLDEVPRLAAEILKGQVRGRVVVDVNR